MGKQVFDTLDNPRVVLEVHGELRVKGSEELQVVAKTDNPEDLQFEQQGEDTIVIRCMSDCTVRAPRLAQVEIQAAYSNAVIKAIEGSVTGKAVHGNLVLRSVGEVKLEQVYGDLEARNVMGSLELQRVDGNVVARDVQGRLSIERVDGNLVIEDVDDGVTAVVAGNATLRLDPAPGDEYKIIADGNIQWGVPEDASAQVNIPRADGKIFVNLPGVGKTSIKAPYTFTLGDGDATVTLEASGNVMFTTQAPHWDTTVDIDMDMARESEDTATAVGDQIAQQIDAQMDLLEQQLNAQLANLSVKLSASGLSPEQAERMQRRTQEISERAVARAQERMRHAQERMERKLAAAQQRAQRQEGRSWSFSWGGPRGPIPPVPPMPNVPPIPPMPHMPHMPPVPPAPAIDPISDEERLTVLRMLQEKKITLEQAEKLLAALEGKES